MEIDEFLEKLDCTTAIEEVWIDSTGVMTAKYNEANWQEEEQEEEEEKVQHKAVVYYVASWPSGQRFVLNPEDTVWTEVKIEVHTVLHTIIHSYNFNIIYMPLNMWEILL